LVDATANPIATAIGSVAMYSFATAIGSVAMYSFAAAIGSVALVVYTPYRMPPPETVVRKHDNLHEIAYLRALFVWHGHCTE